ncbi:MAG: lytic transglycosylase domain-containing protein [Actinomycetales bacterium]|nr:MAG: lytic transglycosylase domain-containing protein [Actinomycetales bacterium]
MGLGIYSSVLTLKGRYQSPMIYALRKPKVVIVAAFLISVIGALDTSYAQESFTQMITIPDNFPTLSSDTQNSNPDAPASEPGVSVDINGLASVDASAIALVSVAARQIELAKSADGAKVVAKTLIADLYNWNLNQVTCLNQLWTNESHWNFQAHNYRSGAQGIAQALPPTKMEIIATDWRTNPVTQIKWGLTYIKARYQTPCNALLKKHRSGYY